MGTPHLENRNAQIRLLEERLRQRRIQLLGPHSETLSDLQLELLADEEPGVTREEVEAEARREPLPQKPAAERKPHPGRRSLPENLPRIEQVIRCAEANCKTCGGETSIIGYDESEVLDVEPARWFVRVTKREKRACAGKVLRLDRDGGAGAAHRGKGFGERRGGNQTVIAKYCDHLPLYRQEAILEREAGVEISRATLDGWVMRVGELLEADGGGDAARSAARILFTGRRNYGAGADARQARRRSSSLLVAIRQAGRRDGVRVSAGPRARGSQEVPGRVGRDSANRRLSSLRQHRRAEIWCTWAVGRTRAASLWMR